MRRVARFAVVAVLVAWVALFVIGALAGLVSGTSPTPVSTPTTQSQTQNVGGVTYEGPYDQDPMGYPDDYPPDDPRVP
jgi:hypothetical protein